MDFAPEPVLDAFTPPPTRAAPRAPVADDNGRTFDDHLDAANEPAVERPAPAQNQAKDESAPATEAKAAPNAEAETSDETIDLDTALLGGPLPPAPPPMAAPVVVQIAVSQPAQQQAQPQDGDAEAAPASAAGPEAPAPAAPVLEADAAPAEPVQQSAPTSGKNGETEVKPAAPDAPQQQAHAPAQNTQQQQQAQQQQQVAPTPASATVEAQQLPPAVQQAIAQTIAPAPQAVMPATPRAGAKDTAKAVEAAAEPNARDGKADAVAPQANARTQAPKAATNGTIAVEPLPAATQSASSAPDATQVAQTNTLATTASQASTHVQQAAVDTGAQRAGTAGAQVGREIIRRFDGGNTSFELRLDPAELGRVEVRMEVSRDHRVTAVITADNPQALTELARHARELEQQLQSAGLQLSDSGLSFDLRQGGQGNETNEANNARGSGGEETLTEQQPTQVARPIGYERWRGVRVDMMV